MPNKAVIDCSQPPDPETGAWPEPELVPLTRDELTAQAAASEAAAAELAAQQWDEVRRARGAQLSATDWLGTKPPDLPDDVDGEIDANAQAWADYRQALRDLPDQGDDPTELVWPTPPDAPSVTIPPPPAFLTPAEP